MFSPALSFPPPFVFLNGQNVRGFQVRTPIFHIMPVSRAYTDPPVRGTDGPFIVENAFNCRGSPCGFNCHGSRGAPKKWPKYRTPTCVRHAVQGCFWACLGGGGLSAPGPSLPNTRTLNREADELHLSKDITPGKLIPKTRSITLHLEKLIQKQLKSVSVSVIFGKLNRNSFKSACNNFGSHGKQFSEPLSVGKLDVGNFASSNTANTLHARN